MITYMLKHLLLLLVLSPLTILAGNNFKISGKAGLIKNGKVVLMKTAPSVFYDIEIKSDTALIRNYQFLFKGKIGAPQEFKMIFIDSGGNEYITEPFFVNSGNTNISFDSLVGAKLFMNPGYHIEVNSSAINDEYFHKFLPFFQNNNLEIDSFFNKYDSCKSIPDKNVRMNCSIEASGLRKLLKEKRAEVLLEYVRQNPNSDIILWALYTSVKRFGYSATYELVMNESNNQQITAKKKWLEAFLSLYRSKSPGGKFPLSEYIRNRVRSTALDSARLILVDFWFSHCIPCIRQFEKLRELYSAYNTRGFEIIAISTDNEESISYYNELLRQKKYPWIQVLDIAGVESDKISITKFPTSFLLDKDGKIISVDTDLDELEYILSNSL